jgi:hypothetical protein
MTDAKEKSVKSVKTYACYFLLAVTCLSGCSLPSGSASDTKRQASYAIPPDPKGVFNRAITSDLKSHSGNSGFHLLPRGQDALVSVLKLSSPLPIRLTCSISRPITTRPAIC